VRQEKVTSQAVVQVIYTSRLRVTCSACHCGQPSGNWGKEDTKASVGKVRALMDQLGVTLEHLSSAVSKKALAVEKAIVGKKAAATKRASKCAAKHADPETGKMWSGFGRAPGWIAGAKNRSAFLVDKSGVESPEATVKAHVAKKKPAAKKASAKKVAKPAAKKAAGVAKAVATPAPAKTTSLPPGGASQLDLARNLR